MREIKFRAWDNHRKKMCYEVDIYCEPPDTWWTGQWYFSDGQKAECFMSADKNNVLMQWTGLLDRLGKEIYEGDILGGNWGLPILYCDKCKSFTGWYICGETKECMNCSGDVSWNEIVEDDGKIEIIGNIYENPGLLETK